MPNLADFFYSILYKIYYYIELNFVILCYFLIPTLLIAITIECQGKAKVHWDKWMLRDNSRTYYECYRAEEFYFKKDIGLYGSGKFSILCMIIDYIVYLLIAK